MATKAYNLELGAWYLEFCRDKLADTYEIKKSYICNIVAIKSYFCLMKKAFSTLGILALILGFIVGGCSKSDDKKDLEPPIISLQSPGDDSLKGGDSLHIVGIISDNELLSQVKIEIHDDFDRHAHLKKAGAAAFAWDSIITLSGKESALNISLLIPEDIASGLYHFQVQALDASGNEAEFVVRSIFLLNAFDTLAPIISNITTNPNVQNGSIEVKTGATLSVMAALSDNLGLEKYELKIIRKSNSEVVYDFDEALTGTAQNLNKLIAIETQWGTGDFILELVVIDEKGNRADLDFDLLIAL